MTRSAEEIQAQADFLAFSGPMAIAKVLASYEERLAGRARQIDITAGVVGILNAEVSRLNAQIFGLLKNMQDSQ